MDFSVNAPFFWFFFGNLSLPTCWWCFEVWFELTLTQIQGLGLAQLQHIPFEVYLKCCVLCSVEV